MEESSDQGNDDDEQGDEGDEANGETADEDGQDPPEGITRVRLTFTPTEDHKGDLVVAEFVDPDGDGPMPGRSDPIVLQQPYDYELVLTLFEASGKEDDEEDVTQKIRDQAEEYQFFIYGEGVRGPSSKSPSSLIAQRYDDHESDYGDDSDGVDLPVGIRNTVDAQTPGEDATIGVMLRHLPPVDGVRQKVPGISGILGTSGAEEVPGEAVFDIEFSLSVEPWN